jgi:hypothetical protein
MVLARKVGYMDCLVKEAIEILLHSDILSETWDLLWVNPRIELPTYFDKVGPASNNGRKDGAATVSSPVSLG